MRSEATESAGQHTAAPEAPPRRPVKLQLNNSGAWKDIVRFDTEEHVKAGMAMTAASHLAAVDKGRWRICTDDGLQCVLMHLEGENWVRTEPGQ